MGAGPERHLNRRELALRDRRREDQAQAPQFITSAVDGPVEENPIHKTAKNGGHRGLERFQRRNRRCGSLVNFRPVTWKSL